MKSWKVKILPILAFVLEAYQASAFYVVNPYNDISLPIPEVFFNIGESRNIYPKKQEVQCCDVQYPLIQPVPAPQYATVSATTLVPQPSQIIIIDDGKNNNSLDLLLVVLLLNSVCNNNCNNGCNGRNNCNCYNNCCGYCGCC